MSNLVRNIFDNNLQIIFENALKISKGSIKIFEGIVKEIKSENWPEISY